MLGTKEKISIFKSLFTGSKYAYGTYEPSNGKHYQVKRKMTDDVIQKHLSGKRPYGFYPLIGNKTRVTVADFDTRNRLNPIDFLNASKHYGLSAYIERSKSKGYHVWIFFAGGGVLAAKARLVLRLVLDDIEKPDTEVFPKQDTLTQHAAHGNFINAPLFGALVPKKKTVFIDPTTFSPYDNQWKFLKSVHRHNESKLDEIIELNNLSIDTHQEYPKTLKHNLNAGNTYGLPPCAQLMLQDGVSQNQRCACFRLAVHLKRLGLPLDGAIALLVHWSHKNKPVDRQKTMITEKEIISQVSYAFKRNYSAYGCESDEVKPYCQTEFPVNMVRSRMSVHRQP